MEQFLTISRGKSHEKTFEPQICDKPAEIGLEIKFFSHFLKFGSLVSLYIAQMIDRDNVQLLVGETNNESSGPKNWLEIRFFAIFSSFQH